MRIYSGKIDARSEGISLCPYLRVSPQKINIVKKTKLGLRELTEVDYMNVKKNATQFNEYFEIYYKNFKKMKKE